LHSTESNDIADRKIFIKYILFFYINLFISIAIQSTDEQLAMIKTSDRTLPVIRSQIEKCIFQKSKTKFCFFLNLFFFF
jgi:hypothetical protein